MRPTGTGLNVRPSSLCGPHVVELATERAASVNLRLVTNDRQEPFGQTKLRFGRWPGSRGRLMPLPNPCVRDSYAFAITFVGVTYFG